MARVGEAVGTDHRHVALMVVRRTCNNELARNGIATTERGEPFDVRKWMWVMANMLWKLEYDANLCNMDH